MLEFSYRLEDILHEESNQEGSRITNPRLYLVFEFMHMDLKKYIDTVHGDLDLMLVKVCSLWLIKPFRILDVPALDSVVSGTRLPWTNISLFYAFCGLYCLLSVATLFCYMYKRSGHVLK